MSLFINIEEKTIINEEYRKILYTDDNLQIIIQCLTPGKTVPFETHEHATQFIRCESGYGYVTFNNTNYALEKDIAIVIPKLTRHKITNISHTEDFKFYTIYGPKVH